MSQDAENAVIAAVLVEPTVLREVREVITPKDFVSGANELIFETVCDMQDDASPIDILTVIEQLRSRRMLERCGGASRVSSMVDYLPDVANAVYYAELVKASSLRRQLGALSSDAKEVSDSAVVGQSLTSSLGRIQAELVEIVTRSSSATRGGWETAQAISRRVAADAEKLSTEGVEAVGGMELGLKELDDYLGGMRPGHLVVVGGRPKAGKTAFALRVLDILASRGKRVALFSLEMGRDEIVQRLLANRTGLWVQAMTNGQMQSAALEALRIATDEIPETLWVDDVGRLSVLDAMARARKLSVKGKLDMVVIDYLQLMKPATRGRSREQEVAEVTRGCKEMAKELQCVVLCVSQLSRQGERDGRRPRLSDFRESGAIEQDLDSAILLHRPLIDRPETEIRLAANRHGPSGPWYRCAFDGLRGEFRILGMAPARQQPTSAKTTAQRSAGPGVPPEQSGERWYEQD